MRFLVFLIALLAAVGCSRPAAAPAATPVDLEAMTVALVEADDDGKAVPYCAGVWVSAEDFVTAYHCVAEELESSPIFAYAVAGSMKSPRTAGVLAIDRTHDLALLSTLAEDRPKHPIARPYFGPLTRGLSVQAMGHPMFLPYSFAKGIISGEGQRLFGIDSPRPFIQTTVPTAPGYSGGGLFTDSGELVGITHGSVRGRPQITLFIPVQYVAELLDR